MSPQCAWCKQFFRPSSRGKKGAAQRFCSKRCAGDGLTKSIWKHCLRCGKPFKAGKQEAHKKSNRYCSRRCGHLDPRDLSKELTPLQIGYIGGLIDGEGSIIAMKRADGSIKSYRLQVTNTCVAALEWCRQVTGIGAIQVKHHGIGATPKPCGNWATYGTKAASVLRQVLPILIIKKEKALAAIALLEP